MRRRDPALWRGWHEGVKLFQIDVEKWFKVYSPEKRKQKQNKELFRSFFSHDEEEPEKRLDLSRREIGRAAWTSTSTFALFLFLLLLQHLAYLRRRWWRMTRRILALQIFQVLAAGEQIVLKMRIRTASSDYKRDSQRDQKDLKGSVLSRTTYPSCQWNRLKMGGPSFIHFFLLTFLSESVITPL